MYLMMRPTHAQRAMPLAMHQMRFFGVMPKLAKMELTIRTPYRTLFENYSGFTRLQVRTIGGDMTIGNKSIPRVYLLPPGEMKVQGLQPGQGNHTSSDTGLFMHTGGWLFVHANNTIDVSLLEVEQRENVAFD
mmetsp:Transcript_34530/g.45424  ORF Transcript_34530/g.45424 Transcript_34530/m.45424 type:complete len:133 (-) Transcript_34530:267-665(-)|eukprot:CAMPEP_0185582016 /NCGR_PEP_ID=MMETSP0434-20130131/19606_1 /TAXON_ID=626734 ORGANISM="Favella taraikaensis, Strain Fe Narragansett Bay" /NCGR_SAMPLE_ID=MMETSP0434 /ASSEMBLY_ACC=CAM_ASM_000379 /LENGTH=132 /DNA_ID=CAMNT_0028200709 /DNA_START=15 /DNA_END=413 /DNA_ORIENTATION=+